MHLILIFSYIDIDTMKSHKHQQFVIVFPTFTTTVSQVYLLLTQSAIHDQENKIKSDQRNDSKAAGIRV